MQNMNSSKQSMAPPQIYSEVFPSFGHFLLKLECLQSKRRFCCVRLLLLSFSPSTRHVSSLPTAIPEHPNDTMACDSKCQAQILANAKKEEETENIVIAITFILIICLVYITGFIVWFWCNRIPEGGISAVQQTDRVALKSTLTANGGHLSHSKVSRKWASNGLEKPQYKREAATTFS